MTPPPSRPVPSIATPWLPSHHHAMVRLIIQNHSMVTRVTPTIHPPCQALSPPPLRPTNKCKIPLLPANPQVRTAVSLPHSCSQRPTHPQIHPPLLAFHRHQVHLAVQFIRRLSSPRTRRLHPSHRIRPLVQAPPCLVLRRRSCSPSRSAVPSLIATRVTSRPMA